MSSSKEVHSIRLRGIRHNNLKGFDLDLPAGNLIVVTGLSGSGKSSLAFDTLYAEGQRRYIETFSPYARQFFDRMDKPQVDDIQNIPPAIAIEQRNAVRSTRSTVGTMTEICDHMKVIWPHIAQLHCRNCQQPVRKETPQAVWQTSSAQSGLQGSERLITFDLPLSDKLALDESLALVAKQGYQRLLVNGAVVRLDEPGIASKLRNQPMLTVVQDRVRLNPGNRSRFIEAAEQAYHFGKGKLTLWEISPASTASNPLHFSARLHCARCDIDYRDPSPALFSFNHPVGACSACKGFGRIITIDYDQAIPDRRQTLKEGAVKPWQSGMSAECQRDLLKFCRATGVPINVPFQELSREQQDWIVQGDPDYGKDEEHEWPRAWYGVKGYFRWLESKAYKMHVRVLLSRYRAYTTCPSCDGARLNPDALLYQLASGPGSLTLADFYRLPISDSFALIQKFLKSSQRHPKDPLTPTFQELHSRLKYLNDIGLGYLTLDRATRTLSGGETERVNLAACLGTRLVNTLFVLDEPSVGLHPRDTERLVGILEALRDESNTVVVVEHEPSVMRAADQIIDLGPGHGATGGELVFQGTYSKILKCRSSLTGNYLSHRKSIPMPQRRTVKRTAKGGNPWLRIDHASRHNLKDLTVEIPLNRFVCISGVSGSGKSTLIREVLLPALQSQLGAPTDPAKASDRLDDESNNADSPEDSPTSTPRLRGAESLSAVVLVDQTTLGKTPRSNPAVYTGAFDHIREVFAQSEPARQQGLNASAFSFNSAQGQCERCRGAGFEKVEMQFLSDVFIRCPDCSGHRYREHILKVKLGTRTDATTSKEYSIADLLEATVDEAVSFLEQFSDSKPAAKAVASLKLLQQVGLGYLQVGQPINTLSGGESQRLKLVRYLADSAAAVYDRRTTSPKDSSGGHRPPLQRTLFLLDEPTTGLHFDDIRILLNALQQLVDAGHSLVVIEHNLDVLKCADWIIDLGPEAGAAGGKLVAAGTPETIATSRGSHTGAYLRQVLNSRSSPRRKKSGSPARTQIDRGGDAE